MDRQGSQQAALAGRILPGRHSPHMIADFALAVRGHERLIALHEIDQADMGLANLTIEMLAPGDGAAKPPTPAGAMAQVGLNLVKKVAVEGHGNRFRV